MVPALAEVSNEYLARVEAIYPYQVLGLVRAGDRFYLLNSRDVDWGDRTRLNLLASRLRESYLTAERQALKAAPGSAPPAGGFVCLATSRAAREGLTRSAIGEINLAAGQSLHLVDPQEPQVAVEVRAGRDSSLNLGEILQRSARTGIYAGLTGQPKQPVSAAGREPPGGTLIVRVAAIGGPAVETRMDTVDWAGGASAIETGATVVAEAEPPRQPVQPAAIPPVAEKPAAQPVPATVIAAVTPPVTPAPQAAEKPQVERVAVIESPRVPAEIQTLPDQRPVATATVAVVTPPPVRTPQAVAAPAPEPAPPVTAPTPAAQERPAVVARLGTISTAAIVPPQPGAEQPYDDYAKAMKTLMALRRSGTVRSVSEMTYVHPAVEMLRPQLR